MPKLGVVPVVQRSVQGPKSFTIYNFQPWANVEERDVEEMLKFTVKQGCGCNGSEQTITPLFAVELDITSGKIKPVWAGQYGAPK